MIQAAGAFIFLIGILGLFVLDRDRRIQTSGALWIPVIWLFLAGSRPVSLWLSVSPTIGSPDDLLEGSPLDRNVFTALIIAALIVLGMRQRRVKKVLHHNLPILMFLVYAGISIIWSDFGDVAFKRWIRAVGDVSMILVILTERDPSAAVDRFLERTSFIILPLSILYEIGRGYSGLSWHTGITTNKNMHGMICMVMGLAAVWRLARMMATDDTKSRAGRLLARVTAVCMAIWLLWTANSATSLACFGLGSFLIIVTTRWPSFRKPVMVHLMATSMILVTFYGLIINPDAGLVSSVGRDPSLTGRTDVWRSVIALTSNPLLGTGFESFWLGPRLRTLWNTYVWRPNEAHNGYIEVYLNLGWIGLALITAIVAKGYRKIVRGLRLNSDTASLCLAYCVVVIIYNLTEAGFRIFTPTWTVFLLSVVSVFTTKREQATVEPAPTVAWGFSSSQEAAANIGDSHEGRTAYEYVRIP